MVNEGGCYCGSVRYKIEGEAAFKVQCYCRECQYISGGGPNVTMAVPEPGFSYTKGGPKDFTRSDIEGAVTRQFCADCGTHLLAKAPAVAGMVLLKVGTLDDPSIYGQADMAIFTIDKQTFHQMPEGAAAFERAPG